VAIEKLKTPRNCATRTAGGAVSWGFQSNHAGILSLTESAVAHFRKDVAESIVQGLHFGTVWPVG
jgi:hypothetical protein